MKKTVKKISSTKKPLPKKPTGVKATKQSKKWWWIVLAIANTVAFAAVIITNYLAVKLPIWWLSTWALADLYPNLFTPAWLTFSIWGLIYVALFLFIIRQIIDLFKKQSKWITKKIHIWFLVSCATNIGWIFAWHYQKIGISVLIIIAFLITLIIIWKKLEFWKKLGSRWDKLLVQVPFSIYQWWLSVAVIANIAAWLVNSKRDMRGMTDIFRTIAVIIIATILTLRKLKKEYNIMFALVVIRAFIGIIIKRLAVDPVYAKEIIWVLGICITIITAGIGARWNLWKKN